MEKVKERTEQYEVSVRITNNGYYEARISTKIGGGRSPRLQKGGKTPELAILNLLIALENYIELAFNSGYITTKIDDIFSQRLVASLNDLGLLTPEISEKVFSIINKINSINSHILNKINLQPNIIPFTNTNENVNSNIIVDNTYINKEPIKDVKKSEEFYNIVDVAIDWIKYKYSLCKETEDNPNPLSKKTIDGYYKTLFNEIIPYFKKNIKFYLIEIDEEIIKSLLKSINGYHGKRNSYIVLSMFFEYAVTQNKMEHEPLKNIKKPVEPAKKEEDKTPFIEPDKQNIWIDKFEEINTDISILFETMLLTGLRPEEACGLKWTALDLESNELIIDNAYKSFVVYDKDMNAIGHERHDDKLKTPESYRRIPLNPRLKEILLKHKENQKLRFKNSIKMKKKGRKWTEKEYIFLGRTYEPYVSDTLSSALPKLCDTYSLERISPYGLRHSFATFCSENGMEEIVLMRLMGHADFQTTQKYYIRVSAKRKRKAMQEAYKVVFYDRAS